MLSLALRLMSSRVAGEAGPPPEPGEITLTLITLPGDPSQSLSISVTAGPGTVHWIIDTVAYPNTSEGAAAVIAGGGEASGSQAYTDSDIDLGAIAAAVTPGEYHISAVAVVDSETSNVASDELTITPVVVTYIGETEGSTSLAIPSGAQVGDRAFLWTSRINATAIADIAGWTPFTQRFNADVRTRGFTKIIGADEPAVVTGVERATLVVYRNAGVITEAAFGNYFTNTVQVPAYAKAGGDVSGSVTWIVCWMRATSTTAQQQNSAPTGVTKRAGHDQAVVGNHVQWVGDATHDSASAFTGPVFTSPTPSNTSHAAQVFKVKVS